MTRKIRWVLAHEPIELFLRAARKFKATMEQTAPGEIEFDIMTLSEYSEKYQGGKEVSKHDLLDLMEAGELEMSQMYTSTLGRKHNRDMWALDMPFLFRDHDHAARVLEGEIGKSLIADMAAKTNVQGLSFTYSGGYRMIPATVALNKIEDFKGVPLRCNKSPIASETFLAVGAEPVEIELEEINEGVVDGRVVGGESTYPRFYGLNQNEHMQVINDAEHSLFLTSIIINKDFWNGMDSMLQEKIQHAAFDAARYERAESIDDIDIVKARAIADGIRINPLPQAERDKFKAATEYLYDKFEDMFKPGLVKSIQAA
ncbi:MAG: hypothetical protein EBY41_01350 [Proteobacteria bacterium]|jgi:TRAP-type C4-dicarboxylate transport system substrate-binding protein|nr:hypothetical protein [Pseudomonadota bacterium]